MRDICWYFAALDGLGAVWRQAQWRWLGSARKTSPARRFCAICKPNAFPMIQSNRTAGLVSAMDYTLRGIRAVTAVADGLQRSLHCFGRYLLRRLGLRSIIVVNIAEDLALL